MRCEGCHVLVGRVQWFDGKGLCKSCAEDFNPKPACKCQSIGCSNPAITEHIVCLACLDRIATKRRERATPPHSRAPAHVSPDPISELEAQVERTGSLLAEERMHNGQLQREVEALRKSLVKAGERERALVDRAVNPPFVLSAGAVNQAGGVTVLRETDHEPLSAWATVGCVVVGAFGASALESFVRWLTT
jgi:hypothetical protein